MDISHKIFNWFRYGTNIWSILNLATLQDKVAKVRISEIAGLQ